MYFYEVNSTNNDLQVDDPLDQAVKFLQPLQTLCSDLLETHLMAYEIYSRKGRAVRVSILIQSYYMSNHTTELYIFMHSVALLVTKIFVKE